MHNFYLEAYDIINRFFFGGIIQEGTYPDMVATVLATAVVVGLFVAPFFIVYQFFKCFIGWVFRI